jgi:hypothetical protein
LGTKATCAAIAGLSLALGWLGGCTRSNPQAVVNTKPAEVSEIPAGSFVAQWRQDLPLKNTQIKALSINDDTVFAFTADNQCFWVNRATGHAQSVAKLADPVDNLYGQVTFKDRVIFPSTKQLAVFDRQGRFAYKIPLRYSASSEAHTQRSLSWK